MATITVNGVEYDSNGAKFAEYAYLDGLIDFAGDFLEDAAQARTTTSTTSVAIGAGSKTFTMAADVNFGVGAYVVIAETAAPTTNNMFGQVTARTGTSLTVDVTQTNGSGTIAAWTISLSGAQGAAGALSGNASGAIDMNGFALTTDALNLTGAVAGADQEVSRVKLKDYSETRVQANTGTSYAIDLENGNVFDLTLTGNVTYTFTNPPDTGISGAFTLIQRQDGTGSRTVTWPASVDWAGGTAPTVTATASSVDVFVFITLDAGTTWYGFTAGQEFS